MISGPSDDPSLDERLFDRSTWTHRPGDNWVRPAAATPPAWPSLGSTGPESRHPAGGIKGQARTTTTPKIIAAESSSVKRDCLLWGKTGRSMMGLSSGDEDKHVGLPEQTLSHF
jgi:hypothetical protein